MDSKKSSANSQKPFIGVDLGGTKILACVVDPDGKIISRNKKKTKAHKSWEKVVERIIKCIRKAVEKAELTMDQVAAVGIGAPGALNPFTGVIHVAPNLGWKEINLSSIMEDDLGVPVFLNNDVNIGTLGEHRRGVGVGLDHLFGMFIGTGIGGGLILNGKIYEGARFMAGEVGHIPMVKDGPVCGCGNRGCFEAVAGRLAIVRDIKKESEKGRKTILKKASGGDFSKVRSKLLSLGWSEKDPLTVEVLEKSAWFIGRGVATVINILNPDAVILGGGVIEALDEDFLNLIRKSVEEHSFPAMTSETKILRAILGDDAVIAGAAAYAADRLYQS